MSVDETHETEIKLQLQRTIELQAREIERLTAALRYLYEEYDSAESNYAGGVIGLL